MARPNSGPGLKLNNRGIYEIRWSEGGRSRRVSTRAAGLQAAQRFLAGFLVDMDGKKSGHPTTTIDEILDSYDNEHVTKTVISKKPARNNIKNIRAHFGGMTVDEIDIKSVEKYCAKRRKGVIGIRTSDGTLRRELGTLVSALNHAVKHKRMAKTDMPVVGMPPEPAPRDRWLTHEECGKLIEASLNGHQAGSPLPRAYIFTMIALHTAARKTAIETLRKDQVDLARGVISLNPAGRAQTKKRRPTLPISSALLPVLAEAIAQSDTDFVLGCGGDVRFLFSAAAERAELKGVTPHVLRHTWATLAAQSGKVQLWQIAAVLGDTIATVVKRYLHHQPEHLRSAVDFRIDVAPQAGHNAQIGINNDQQQAHEIQ